eukprot:CAMPEP_0169439562 /NCGR_PEP_ID=MMETSP1042-20121227/7276_1 /TAXON_ID=464988 /ORGANISM="Hemiselmis andersenii, Strain CCMP1180" /LENGTH=35 /DNA_ID= /DNA_START= /DNA_END= /DNA_ORIENTATION=
MTQGVVDVATGSNATPPPAQQAFCRPGMILRLANP